MFILKLFLLTALISQSLEDSSRCGLADQASGTILGGTESTRGKYPWLVALIHAEFNDFFCGGTLISTRHVTTAAHCIQPKFRMEPKKAGEIIAYMGRHELSRPFERSSQIGYPRKILLHPDWSHESSNYDADIAIIFLESDVTFNLYISPICVTNVANSGSSGFVAGWGHSGSELAGQPANTPKHIKVKIVENAECFLAHYQLTFIASQRTFCGKGENGGGPCLGDSGGGFFVKKDRKWFLRGIVSASLLNSNNTCDVTKLSIFTNVPDYSNWILQSSGLDLTETPLTTPKNNSLEIITRSMWNAAAPGPDVLLLSPPSKRIMISHTVTEECLNLNDCAAQLQAMQATNQKTDYNDIYCNFFIGGDGLIFEGRGWTVRGEHTVSSTQSHNEAVCVSFIGNFQQAPPKQSCIDAFFKLLDHGVSTNKLAADYAINAQRDFHSSESPGAAFYKVIKTWPRYKNI